MTNTRRILWTAAGKELRRYQYSLFAVAGLVILLAQGLGGSVTVYASTLLTPAGYLDFSYSGTTVADPTGEKPESKLWWNDGFWWGSLYNGAASQYRTYRLNWGTQTWEDTGVALDDREDSKSDALWDAANSKLYVVSHVYTGVSAPTSASADKGRLYRYSYDPAAQSYSLDGGFPVDVNNDRTETLVLDKDSTGRLWITYVSRPSAGSSDYQVYVNTSAGPGLVNDDNWGTPTPFSLGSLFSAAHVGSDDIASLIAFRDNVGHRMGIMWSNHLTTNVSFATHDDSNSNPQTGWSIVTIPIPVTPAADDHINIKSLQTTSSGQVFAAIKTSASASNPTDPLIGMVARDTDGTLSFHTYSTKANGNTRPILLIDQGNLGLPADDQVYIFVTDNEGGGRICYKTAAITTPLSAMSFPPGVCGTPFIADTAVHLVNNSTSTKQNVNSTTGIVILASDEVDSQFYVHNILGDPPPVITARLPGFNTTNVPVNSTISATFSKPMNASTLTTANFIVANGDGPVAGTITYSATTRTAAFTPATFLRANSLYTVTVSGAVQDASGQALFASASNVWNFTTELPTVRFSSAAYSVGEGTGTPVSATITATLNTSSTTNVMVNYATVPGGTATAGTDYASVNSTLTFSPGQTSQTFTVPITPDAIDEPNETVSLALSGPTNATLGTPGSSILTMVDDDPMPTVMLGASAYSVAESSGVATITATLSAPSAFTITVDYGTSNGTALAGSDYVTTTGTLTFTSGLTLTTFTVPITSDALAEPDETVNLTLSDTVSATLGTPGTATLTIVDDDTPPTVQFSTNSYSVGEGSSTARITVTLSSPYAFTVTVNYATSSGTATAGADYTSVLTTTLSFAPGQTSRTFTVTILDDSLIEGNETVNLVLSSPSPATLGAPNSAALTIVDNEFLRILYLPLIIYSP